MHATRLSFQVKEAMLLTSPINFCEATSHMYKNILGGLFSNAWVVSVLVLLAILYSTCVSNRFKKYLCFRDAFIVAIVSTYILSLGDFLAGGAGGGTSIIGFDMLFYLLLAFGFGLRDTHKREGICKNSPAPTLFWLCGAHSPNTVFHGCCLFDDS